MYTISCKESDNATSIKVFIEKTQCTFRKKRYWDIYRLSHQTIQALRLPSTKSLVD